MPSVQPLQQIQLGKEVTWGTAVAPTVRLMAVESAEIAPMIETVVDPDLRGSLAPGYLSYQTAAWGEATITAKATYEDLPYLLDSAFGTATPSGTGPYVYAYAGQADTAPTPSFYTLTYGDSTRAYALSGALVQSLTIAGEKNQPVTVEANFIGQQAETDSVAVLSDRAVNYIHGNNVALYIDAGGGTIGSTAITTPAFSFSLNVENLWKVEHALGNQLPVTYYADRVGVTFELTIEAAATSAAYMSSLLGLAQVPHLIRLRFTNSTRVFDIDFAGVLTEAPAVYDDQDGIMSFALTYGGRYDTSLASYLDLSVTNGVSALP